MFRMNKLRRYAKRHTPFLMTAMLALSLVVAVAGGVAADPVLTASKFRSVNVGLLPIPFDSGNVSTRRLPVGNLLKGLILRLNGSITFSAGTPTAVGNELPLELIQKIEIVTDTNRTLWSTTGRDAFRYAHFMYGKQNELIAPNFAASPAVFSATIRLPIEALKFVKPVESYNNTRRYQNIDLRITWGTLANVATGGTNTAVASTTAIDIIAQMSTVGFGIQRVDKILSFDQIAVTATQSNLSQDVPRNGLLARILVRATRNAATVDDLVNKLSLVVDYSGRARDTLTWRTVQQGNVQDYQLDGASVVGSQIPGYAMLDVTEDGYMSSCLNTYLTNKVQTVLDVTRTSGTELVQLTYEFFEPLKEALGEQRGA